MARKKKSQNIIDGWRMHDALCHAGLSAMEWDPWIRHSYMDEFCQKSSKKKRNFARTDHSVEYDYMASRMQSRNINFAARQGVPDSSGTVCSQTIWTCTGSWELL